MEKFTCCDCGGVFDRPNCRGPSPSRCADCRLEAKRLRDQAYAKSERGRERARARSRRHYERHPERANGWQKRNPKQAREASRRSWWKNPARSRELQREKNQRWRESDPDGRWRSKLKTKYGITPEQFDEMLAAQGGGCAICGSSEPFGRGRFHVDHNHSSGAVRGLLCTRCNPGLGFFNDDPALLRAAIDYLKE